MFIFDKIVNIRLIDEKPEMFYQETIFTILYFIKIRIAKKSMLISDLNKLYKKTTKIKGFNEIVCT